MRWLRRFLMFLLTWLVVSSGGLWADEAEGKAIKAIENAGGIVSREKDSVVFLRLREGASANGSLEALALLKQLKSVWLGRGFSDASLKKLAACQQIEVRRDCAG